ncbi:MAG: hypothetical protein AAB425_14850, partial [Bdellovibrionota bacterium]
ATYVYLSGGLNVDKWSFKLAGMYAVAGQTAGSGSYFFNNVTHQMSAAPAVADQRSSLGWEFDFGSTLHWDDSLQLGIDMGLFVPGAYYKFSNTATENATSVAFGTLARVGVNF